MAKKGASVGQKARHSAYAAQDRAGKNKERKLIKHIKKHAADLQAQEALKNGIKKTRKKPNSKNGWVTESIKSYYGGFQSVFSKHNSSYTDLSVIGKESFMKVARFAKLSRKCDKLPNVFNKGVVHKLYSID